MGETDLHRDMMIDLIEALRHFFADRKQVYVSGNILLYYEKGNIHRHISPDVLIGLGIPGHKRQIYKVWEEGKAPDFIIEVTSRKTRQRDRVIKKNLYQKLGVKEYLLFDPRAEYLDPRFQVFRLENAEFVPVLAPESSGYDSPQLGLSFRVVNGTLRVFDTASNRLLPTPAEQAQRADQEAHRAEREAHRADQEARRADRQSKRVAQLEARLRELGVDPSSL